MRNASVHCWLLQQEPVLVLRPIANPDNQYAQSAQITPPAQKPSKGKAKWVVLAAVLACLLGAGAFFAINSGLLGSSYSLTKDQSIKTDWKTTLQFKVDPSWKDTSSPSNDEDSASASYADEKGEPWVNISLKNVDGMYYKLNSATTYEDWIKLNGNVYTLSAEEQAQFYKDTMADSSYYNANQASADNYPDYKDYSLKELGSKTIDGVGFRLYKMKVTVSMSDKMYNKAKQNNSEAKQTTVMEVYYAIVKDGNHDLEIAASSEKLLNDFLSTLVIS